MCSRLQPYEARLQPYVLEAVTVCHRELAGLSGADNNLVRFTPFTLTLTLTLTLNPNPNPNPSPHPNPHPQP